MGKGKYDGGKGKGKGKYDGGKGKGKGKSDGKGKGGKGKGRGRGGGGGFTDMSLVPWAGVCPTRKLCERVNISKDLQEHMKDSGVVSKDFDKRKSRGKGGRAIKIATNLFKMAFPQKEFITLEHYDIAIFAISKKDASRGTIDVAGKLPRNLKRDIVYSFWKKCNNGFKGNMAYDGGKILFTSPDKFTQDEKTAEDITVPDNGEDRSFHVVVTHIKGLSTQSFDAFLKNQVTEEPLDLITALEICLKHHLVSTNRFFDAGRRFFAYPNGKSVRSTDLGGGVELWMGFVQAIKITERSVMLNIDRTASGFFKEQHLMDFVKDTLNTNDLSRVSSNQWMNLKKVMSGVEIYQTHRGANKRRFKIKGVSRKSAKEEKFTDDKGKEWTVASYFAKNYAKLRYPDLPLVEVGMGKKMYLPMEVCHVSGKQRVVKLLADYQVAEMIKKTSCSPQEHLSDIRRYIAENKYTAKENFNMSISHDIETVKGRIINPPELQYLDARGKVVLERPGSGSWNMRDKKNDHWGRSGDVGGFMPC